MTFRIVRRRALLLFLCSAVSAAPSTCEERCPGAEEVEPAKQRLKQHSGGGAWDGSAPPLELYRYPALPSSAHAEHRGRSFA